MITPILESHNIKLLYYQLPNLHLSTPSLFLIYESKIVAGADLTETSDYYN